MLNVAIVGCGNISPQHIRGYLAFPDEARIVALCDIVSSRATDKAVKFGLVGSDGIPTVAIYDHISEVLARKDIDVVSIATPPGTHAELTIQALEAGKHVIVEKPMAPTLAECDAMIEAARSNNRLLSVISQNRFRDDIALLKALIDSGLLGEITAIQVDSAWWRGLEYYDVDWRGTWESEGGGPTLNHAIHHLDLTAWLMGDSPQAVSALMTNAAHENSEVEDLSVAILQYPRALATVIASVIHHGQQQRFSIHGRNATVELPWQVRAEVSEKSGHPNENGNLELIAQLEALRANLPELSVRGHVAQIGDVLAAISEGRVPMVTGEEGRRTVEIVLAIYRAAIERKVIDLPIAKDNPWYSGEALLELAPRYFKKTGFVTETYAPSSAKAARWEQ